VLGNKTIVTNGDQTDTIDDGLTAGKTFEESLRCREFEPDGPNFTPRISGLLTLHNGAFSYDEVGTGSLYEFIYSFRDNIDDPFPDFRSENALNALKMMKKLKEELASDKIYIDLDGNHENLINGNGLFIKQNHIKFPANNAYEVTILPGSKEGISGSYIGGDNISINKFIEKEKVEAAIKALQYMTSKDVQKRMMAEFNIFSGIYSLYKEKELCDMGDLCDIYKNVQPVVKPISRTNDYLEYSQRIRRYIYKFRTKNK